MKCLWKDCDEQARAKSPFCSGTCKKRFQRASGTDVPVEVGQEQVGQPSGTRFIYGPGESMVYGRRVVIYPNDRFDTRPEPLDHLDKPDLLNRCIYRRQDGTRYLLDATGNAHERGAA